MNIKGQFARKLSYTGSRYYGLAPLCLKSMGQELIPPPPLVKTISPRLAGFLLSCYDNKYVYGMGLCDNATVQKRDGLLFILGRGKCIRVARHAPRSRAIVQKIRAYFDKIGRYPLDRVLSVVKSYYNSFSGRLEFGPIEYSRIIVVLPNGLIFFNLFKAMETIDVHVPLVSVRLFEEQGWNVFQIDDQTLDVQYNENSVASLKIIYPQALKTVHRLGCYPTSKGYCGIWEANIEKWKADPGDTIGSSYAFWTNRHENTCLNLSPNPPEVQIVKVNSDDNEVIIKANLEDCKVSITRS